MMNRRKFFGGLGASLSASLAACQVSFDPNEEVSAAEQADTVWPDGSYARFRDNGFLFATHPYTDLSYMHVIAAGAGSNWAANNAARFAVIVKTMSGGPRRLVWGRASSLQREQELCSEFTRWVYLRTGATDISFRAVASGRAWPATACRASPV